VKGRTANTQSVATDHWAKSRTLTSMQSMQNRPLRGIDTPALLRILRRVVDITLPLPTLNRWLHQGTVVSSVFQSRKRGRSHRWSTADVVLVAWLLRLRRAGCAIHQHHMRSAWSRLTAGLEAPGPRYLVVLGGAQLTVLGQSELDARIADPQTGVVVAWLAPSLEQIRRAAELEGFGDVP